MSAARGGKFDSKTYKFPAACTASGSVVNALADNWNEIWRMESLERPTMRTPKGKIKVTGKTPKQAPRSLSSRSSLSKPKSVTSGGNVLRELAFLNKA